MKIAILAISLAAAAAGQTFPITGAVVDANSGSTMKRVRVALNPYGVRGREMAVVTREDGRFSFDVPRGKYVLTAEYRGTRQPFGLSGPGIGFNVALFTGPDQDTSNLVFRWFPLGAITGKVVDDRGEPANGVLVQLIRASVNLGRRRLVSAGWLYTNDVGEYRFYPVTGGTYYLVVTGAPWYATRGRPVFSVEDGSVTPVDTTNQASPAYAPAYYPNAIDISGASPLSVAPGAEVHADFTLRTINGVNVHVHSPNAKRGSGMLSLLADGIEGVQGFQRQASLTGESQTIFSVPPGRYTVRIAGSGDNPFQAQKTIDVGVSDVTVELSMQPAPTATGQVTFRNPGTRPRATVYVRLTDPATNVAIAQPVDGQGFFTFKNIPPGKRRLLLSGTDGFFISEMSAEGATLEDGVLDVASGASIQLKIVASDETGHLKGLVKGGEKPVPGVLAVLAPVTPSTDPYRYHGFQTDSDGSFDWDNVRAGDYVLFAVDRLDFEYANPEAVKPYLASGKPIHIGAHTVSNEDISVSAPLVQP